jgi:hypothetical protein
VNNKDGDGKAEYKDTASTGYKIETGKSNIIDMKMTTIEIDPVPDFTIAWSGGSTPAPTIERVVTIDLVLAEVVTKLTVAQNALINVSTNASTDNVDGKVALGAAVSESGTAVTTAGTPTIDNVTAAIVKVTTAVNLAEEVAKKSDAAPENNNGAIQSKTAEASVALVQAKAAYVKTSRLGDLVMVLPKKDDINTNADLEITVEMSGYLKHLIYADGSGDLNIGNTMALVPVQTGDKFVFFSRAEAEGDENYLTVSGSDDEIATIVYTFDNAKLPNLDAYGVLYLDLTYYPFSDDQSGGRKWYIRNGLNYNHIDNNGSRADGDPSGGAIFVIVGEGGGDTSTTTEIEMGFE